MFGVRAIALLRLDPGSICVLVRSCVVFDFGLLACHPPKLGLPLLRAFCNLLAACIVAVLQMARCGFNNPFHCVDMLLRGSALIGHQPRCEQEFSTSRACRWLLLPPLQRFNFVHRLFELGFCESVFQLASCSCCFAAMLDS